MEIRPSTGGGERRRHRSFAPALLATTALTAAGPALVCAALALGLTTAPARADDWTGTVSDDWFTGGNWVDGSAPVAADNVTIDTTAHNPTAIDAAAGAAGDINVGLFGAGTLTIRNGGSLDDDHAAIGYGADSNGTVTVIGDGSSWASSAHLWVGYGGTGTLFVSDRAHVTDDVGVIGVGSGSVGTATVTDNGSTWANAGNLYVGDYGNGTLNIESGGAVSDVAGFIGFYEGSVGKVTVAGHDSTWTNSGSLTVGNFGAGTLTIENSGAVSNTFGYVGGAAGSTSTVTVTGSDSSWTNSKTLFVGEDGQGSLTVKDHGSVDSANGVIGAYSTGAVTVTGAGSNWTTTGELIVGSQGDGTLTVKDGGAVGNANSYIGKEEGSTGEVVVAGGGSTWTNTGYLFIGEHGTGTLTIEDGGAITVDGNASIGRDSGGIGTAIVTGAGSTWTVNDFLFVGDQEDSQGSLTVEHSGKLVTNSQVRIGEDVETQGTALVTGAGSKWVAAPGQFHVGFWGDGSLTIADGGEVSGGGFTTIGTWGGSSGTVKVTGAGSVWNSSVSGSLHVGDRGMGRLIVEDGAAVIGGDGSIGTEASAVGEVSVTGAGSTWTNAGNLYVGSLGTGSLTIGAGATVSAGGVVSVADQIGSSGILVVDGTLVGTGGVGINAGGRLQGSGMVTGNTTIAGTIAPGNSIGTLHVAGPYTQAAGSFYEVEIDSAGNSDLIDVSGTATLNGGTVRVVPFPGFALTTPYTILTATGGVTGTFAGATMGFSSAFLSPELTYHTNDVTIAVAQTASFASAGLTPNQRAAAEGADSLGLGNPVWNAVAMLPSAAEAPPAFDAISGEVHASAKSMLIEDSRFVREAIDARLRAAFAGVGANAAPVVTYGKDGRKTARADTDRFAVWGHAFGSWGKWDSDGNAAALTRDTGGFVFGGDAAVGETWRLGLMAGYSHSSFDVKNRSSSGTVDSYHLGAYAGTEIGQFSLRFGGAYSWHDIETARGVAFPGFSDSLSANYDAATAQIFGEAGYRIDIGAASFEPFANLAYVNLHTDGFTEKGGAAALRAASASEDTTFTTLGLRAEAELPVGGIAAKIHGMLGWRHAFGDTVPTASLAFAGSDVFSVAGVPIAKDTAVIEAGLEVALSPNANLGIAYSGLLGDGVQDHGLKAQLGITF
jgi:outer membrane autotransporter protein